MIILAIDGSTTAASVAVMRDDRIIGSLTVDYERPHSETLVPIIESLIKRLEIGLDDVDAIAVSAGPGSFTGLRIAAATAKGLALALDKPIISVPSLKALAYNLNLFKGTIVPVVDARVNQVYIAGYKMEDGEFKEVVPQRLAGMDEVKETLNSIDDEIMLVGNGADRYGKDIEEACGKSFLYSPPYMAVQDAVSTAILGLELYNKGETCDSFNFKPIYLQISQAERQKLLKDKKA